MPPKRVVPAKEAKKLGLSGKNYFRDFKLKNTRLKLKEKYLSSTFKKYDHLYIETVIFLESTRPVSEEDTHTF